MRNISFMLTTAQFLDGSKDVTRRLGWEFAEEGDILRAVEKSQGLGKGGKIKPIGLIRLVDVRREPLRRMTDDLEYGRRECLREGFPSHHPRGNPGIFVFWFCQSHRGCTQETEITRIEFVKVEKP